MIRRILPRLAHLRDRTFDHAGAVVDRALVAAALDIARRAPDRERVARDDHDARLAELSRVTDAYDDPRYLEEPERFFPAPPPMTLRQEPVRALRDGRGAVLDLVWESGYEPLHGVPREEYLSHVENRTAYARAWLHPGPRHAVVCVHGYLGGRWAMEEPAFSTAWLHELGVDVAIALLPFHGARCPSGRNGMFPGRDPWRTVEGFRQAVHDLRALIAWLRARGCPSVTVFGMSLGAYTTALLATACDEVDRAVLMIPLASMADAYLEHREGREDAPPEWIRGRIDAAYRVVSPFARVPRVTGDRVLVLAANGDRITRRSHAEGLRAHFDATLEMFPGGHILQGGRRKAFGAVAKLLARHGAIVPRH